MARPVLTLTVNSNVSIHEWSEGLHATQSQIEQAAVRALNKTARSLRTQVSREAGQRLTISVGAIRQSLKLVAVRRGRPEAVLSLPTAAGVIPAVKTGRAQHNRRGVRVGRRQYDRAFPATMPSGHRGVFRRRGKTRLPIQEVTLVLTGVLRELFEDAAETSALNTLQKTFIRELRFIVSR